METETFHKNVEWLADFSTGFVKGTLMGGNKKTQQAIQDGSLQKILSSAEEVND